MKEQPNRLPLAQYLRLFELARALDSGIIEDISIESIEGDIRRQLEAVLPASDLTTGLESYADLKEEEEALRRIRDTIQAEIRPVAASLSPGFVDGLQAEYQERWDAVRDKLALSVQLDKAYRDTREEEGQAFRKKQEIVLQAQQAGVGLQSVTDLAQEIARLEAVQEEIDAYQKRSAQEWAALAEGQIDEPKARAFWEKALQQDNSPAMADRRDRHVAALGELGAETVHALADSLQEAQAAYQCVAWAAWESSPQPENDLRPAMERCDYVLAALSKHPYATAMGRQASSLRDQISAYNDQTWQSQAIGWIAKAEVELASDDLGEANKNLAFANQALARVWDAELQSSLADHVDAMRQRIDASGRQRNEHIIDNWRQLARTYLDGRDAIAALNCVYAAKALTQDISPQDDLLADLACLEDEALAALPGGVSLDAVPLAERGKELLAAGDRQAAFRWLEAALQLDAQTILSDPSFAELADLYFDARSQRFKVETLVYQAEFRLAQDACDSEHMAVAEGFLDEARQLLENVGDTGRLVEVDEKRTALQRVHRQALTDELNGLLEKLQDLPEARPAASPDKDDRLAVLKEVNRVLAKIDKARFTVENARPSLQKAFDYYTQVLADDKSRDNLTSIEGYTLSHMLLSKVSNWEEN